MITGGIYPFKIGGVENHVYHLSRNLHIEGIDVQILCEGHHPFIAKDLSGIIIHSLKFQYNKYFPVILDNYSNFARERQAVSYLDKKYHGFDIIHLHGRHGLPLSVFSKRYNQKFVYTVHGPLYSQFISFLRNSRSFGLKSIIKTIITDLQLILLQKRMLERSCPLRSA